MAISVYVLSHWVPLSYGLVPHQSKKSLVNKCVCAEVTAKRGSVCCRAYV